VSRDLFLCEIVETREHAKVVGRPPHCGPRRPHTITRAVTTDGVQLQQPPSVSTKHSTQTLTSTTPAPVSPASTWRCATTAASDLHSPVNPLDIRAGCHLWSVECSGSSTAAQKYESPGRPSLCGDVRSLHGAMLPLDDVDLWDEISDSELMTLRTTTDPVPTTTNNQTWTSAADDNAVNHASEQPGWNRRYQQDATSCRLSQQTGSSSTPAVDAAKGSDWSCPSSTQTAPAGTYTSCGFIPRIIESSGRPATANRCAADLSNGSVELRQRQTGAGLNLYVRGMQLRLLGNREHSMTIPEVRVNEAKVLKAKRFNDVTSSQQYHNSVNGLHLTSRWSCSTLRFY